MALSFLQTDEWADFKTRLGWKAARHDGLLGLTRQLPLGKSLEYFPEIPLDHRSLRIARSLKQSRLPGRIFTRLEFFELWSAAAAKKLVDLGLIKSFEEVQPEYRQWINLAQSSKDLINQMKPKGRYNLKLAQRKKLKVRVGLEPSLVGALFDLYEETSRRAGFSGRPETYFRELAALLEKHNRGTVVSVWYNDKPLAALMITFCGGIASYLYGGSSSRSRELMAPYLAHFEAMKLAKRRLCKIYDLLAIAPEGSPNHPYAGLTRFKQSLGGRPVRLLGSWDLVHNRFWYKIYKFAERKRRRVLL